MPLRLRLQYTQYPHWGNYSGFNQLAYFVDRQRFEVKLHAASDSHGIQAISHEGVRQWLRSYIPEGDMPWYKFSDVAAEIRAFPGCFLRRTHIVHFLDGEHCPRFLPKVLKQSKWIRTKTMVTYHQPPELLVKLVKPEVLTHIDHVTVVSSSQLPFFQQFLPSDRLTMLRHGINTDFFRPEPNIHKKKGCFKCITVGYWFRDWPAIRQVIEALKGKTDIEFHIVGKWVTGLEDLPNVIIHRTVQDTKLLALYQEADLLFLPLTQSTANNTLLEGMACGLPVISTNLASILEYLPGDEGILVRNNERSLLIEAINRLKTNPDLRQKMSRQARARAEELSWRNIAPNYEALYASLVHFE